MPEIQVKWFFVCLDFRTNLIVSSHSVSWYFKEIKRQQLSRIISHLKTNLLVHINYI